MAAGVALFMIDLDHRRLPFAITGVLGGLVVVGLAIDVAVDGGGPVPTALMSTGVWIAVYGGIWLATAGRGMGLGDVTLAPVLGLALGWPAGVPRAHGAHGWLRRRGPGRRRPARLESGGGEVTDTARPLYAVRSGLGLFGSPLWQGYLGARRPR